MTAKFTVTYHVPNIVLSTSHTLPHSVHTKTQTTDEDTEACTMTEHVDNHRIDYKHKISVSMINVTNLIL